MPSIIRQTVKPISASAYSITPSDEDHYLRFTSGSATTVTVAPGAWIIGAKFDAEQGGTGKLTFSASGVTINPAGTLSAAAQFAVMHMEYVATNVWTLSGSIGA